MLSHVQKTETEMKVKALILAAGKGTRLQTEGVDLPKVMRTALGKPLLGHVIDSLEFIGEDNIIIVVGYKKEQIMKEFGGFEFAVQHEQLGTGHAVMSAKENLKDFDGAVLVCCGDTPAVKSETYRQLLETYSRERADCAVLSGIMEDGGAYGRIIRDNSGAFVKIKEAADCTAAEREIKEINSGVYVFSSKLMFSALEKINNRNAQGEYYLTDIPEIIARSGGRVAVYAKKLGDELIGVNTPEQLKEVEQILKART